MVNRSLATRVVATTKGNGALHWIEEDDVGLEALTREFRRAGLDCSVDGDGDLCLRKLSTPMWASVAFDHRRLRLFTMLPLKADLVGPQTIIRVNALNAAVVGPKFFVAEAAFYADVWLCFAGGLSMRQTLRMARDLAAGFGYAVAALGPASFEIPVGLNPGSAQ